MKSKLNIEKIQNTDVEYIQQILYDYYIKNLNENKKQQYYFYNRVHNVDFTDKDIYWTLSQMGVITIKCSNQNQAVLLDIMLEVLFMKNKSYFKYYLDGYFDNMSNIDYQKGLFTIDNFMEYLIKSHIENELISQPFKKLKEIDNEFPPILEEYNKNNELIKRLEFLTINEAFIYTPKLILNLLKNNNLKENKIDRVKQLLAI